MIAAVNVMPANVSLQKSSRLLFLDNIRILLSILVILHHLAITYGAPGDWYYKECPPDPFTFPVFSLFVAINQAFFMGFFFLIAGYFCKISFHKKGVGQYLKDKLVRLGIPLLVSLLIINDAVIYLYMAGIKGFEGGFFKHLAQHKSLGVGPMWFVQNLLLFSFVFGLIQSQRKATPRDYDQTEPITGIKGFITMAVILGLFTFVTRIWFKVGDWIPICNAQPAHFPQYITFFIVGIFASRHNWFMRFSNNLGRYGIIQFGCMIALFPVIFLAGGALSGNVDVFMGGLTWQSLAYSLWEQFLGIGVILAIVLFFRNNINRQGELAKVMSDSSYTVYIIHAFLVVWITIALKDIQLHPLLKFPLMAGIIVPICFCTGALIRKLPILKAIL